MFRHKSFLAEGDDPPTRNVEKREGVLTEHAKDLALDKDQTQTDETAHVCLWRKEYAWAILAG